MTDSTATPATQEAAATPTPADVAAAAAAKQAAPADKVLNLTQSQLESIVSERLARAEASSEKKIGERIAELEASFKKDQEEARTTALNALLERHLTSSHDPAKFATLIKIQNPDLDPKDPTAVAAAAKEFLDASPWALTEPGSHTSVTPAPGVNASGTAGAQILTEAELDAFTPEELASDPEKMKLYIASRKAHRS